MTLFRTITRTFVSATIIATLLITNVLTLTNMAVHDALYKVVEFAQLTRLSNNTPTKKRAELERRNKRLQSENKKLAKNNKSLTSKNETLAKKSNELNQRNRLLTKRHTAKLNKINVVSKRIMIRTVRNVGINVASIPAEVIPWLGIASVVGVTAMDIHDGCSTMKDINELLGVDEMDNGAHKVCGYEVPSIDDLTTSMKSKVEPKTNVKSQYADFQYVLGGTINEAKENIEQSWIGFGDVLGGTIDGIFH